MPKRVKVVTVSLHGSRCHAFLDSGAEPNLLSCHAVETLEREMKVTPEMVPVADGHVSNALGIFRSF